MDDKKSRYNDVERYTVPGPDGQAVTVSKSPRRDRPNRRGLHLRRDGERLDHLGGYYLDDSAGYWRICDMNNTLIPEALTDRRQIDIPEGS